LDEYIQTDLGGGESCSVMQKENEPKANITYILNLENLEYVWIRVCKFDLG
jgi:hypothetical protein